MFKCSLRIAMVLVGFQLNAQIVSIPDANFKDALVNEPVVDTNGDGQGDTVADLNGDGEIQITEAEAVIHLYVQEQYIDSMEGIQAFINLETLDCSTNYFTEIDLSQNIKLRTLLTITNSHTTQLDLSHNPDLNYLSCYGNNALEELNVSQNHQLTYLNCAAQLLTSLDVTQNPLLKELHCQYGLIPTVDLSNNPLLEYLNCSGDALISLDVTHNPNLKELYCDSGNFTQLDLSQNLNLTGLHAGGTQLEELDLSQNVNLEWVWCGFSEMPTIDFTNNPNLIWFQSGFSKFTHLDFSQNPNVTFISVGSEFLEFLDISNGNNELLTYLRVKGSPNNYCIQVDDEDYAYNNEDWVKDKWAIYSEDCTLGIPEHDSEEIIVYPNPVKDILRIDTKFNSLNSVKIYDATGKLLLQQLEGLHEIDVSQLKDSVLFLILETDQGVINKRVIKG